jgi:hypothetical protein
LRPVHILSTKLGRSVPNAKRIWARSF